MKRKDAIGAASAATSADHAQLNAEIAELLRRVRWRVDQELTRRSIEPIFKENYYSYDKDEFLLDADFEFIKVRNLLNKSPKLLRDDPIMGVDYLKVINLIKQKKVLENSSDHYDPTAAHQAHYHDVGKAERLTKMR